MGRLRDLQCIFAVTYGPPSIIDLYDICLTHIGIIPNATLAERETFLSELYSCYPKVRLREFTPVQYAHIKGMLQRNIWFNRCSLLACLAYLIGDL